MRKLVLALVLVLMASGVQAATLSLTPDQSIYNVGDTITLTIDGDWQGESTQAIYGALTLTGDGGASLVNVTQSQIA